MSLKRITSLMAAVLAVAVAAPALAGGITTRQMATSSSAPAAVPGAGSAGTSDAVARADHSHACTAASAGASGCLQPADYQSFAGKVSSVTGTAPIVSSGGATPAISCTAASASTGGCLTIGAQTFAGTKTFSDGIAFGDGTTQTTASPAWDDLARRRIVWDIPGANTTSFAADLNSAPGITSTSATFVDDGSPEAWLNYASGGTLGSSGGIYSYTATRWARLPIMKLRFKSVDTAGLRIWLVLSSGALTAVTLDGAYGSGTSEFAGAAFDAAYSGNWQCCSGTGDPLEYGCTDTGVAVAADTEYAIRIAVVPLSSTTCTINGTTVVRTATPPDPALNRPIGFLLTHYTTVAAVRNIRLSRFSLETY